MATMSKQQEWEEILEKSFQNLTVHEELTFWLSSRLYNLGFAQKFTCLLSDIKYMDSGDPLQNPKADLSLEMVCLGSYDEWILCYSERYAKFFCLERSMVVNPLDEFLNPEFCEIMRVSYLRSSELEV